VRGDYSKGLKQDGLELKHILVMKKSSLETDVKMVATLWKIQGANCNAAAYREKVKLALQQVVETNVSFEVRTPSTYKKLSYLHNVP
jgi:hypothetical protein